MIIFNDIVNFTSPFNIVFICGTALRRNDPSDKRLILSSYINSLGYESLILEQNFDFKDNSLFSYKNIGLNNLRDVEKLTSLLVDGVFIIHESYSTAAELGLFSANEQLSNKICVIVPDYFSVEESKIPTFMKLAFWHDSKNVLKPPIVYYPKTKIEISSEKNRKVLTYFRDDGISPMLGLEIQTFMSEMIKPISIPFRKGEYGNHIQNACSYLIENNKVYISLPCEAIKYYLMSMFSLPEFKRELKSEENVKVIIQKTRDRFLTILKNTIEQRSGKSLNGSKLVIKLDCVNDLDIDQAIAYSLYLFHAIDLVNLKNKKDKFVCKHGFKDVYSKFSGLIIDKESVPLGGFYNGKL